MLGLEVLRERLADVLVLALRERLLVEAVRRRDEVDEELVGVVGLDRTRSSGFNGRVDARARSRRRGTRSVVERGA